jgi:hypothetical protein
MAEHNTRATMRFDDPNNVPLLLNVPNEVLLGISDELHMFDRAALALTCKDIAARLQASSQLDWDGPGKNVPREPDSEWPMHSVRKQTNTTVQGGRFRTVPTNRTMCTVGTMVPLVRTMVPIVYLTG